MKNIWLPLVCSIFIMPNAVASDIGKALGKSNVSRLELLANNMNILTVLEQAQNKIKINKQKKDNDIENNVTKFSVSKGHKIMIERIYTAPVTMVTIDECNKQLTKLIESMSKLSAAFVMVSAIPLTPEQAQQISEEALIIVYMQAKENPQLSLNCHTKNYQQITPVS